MKIVPFMIFIYTLMLHSCTEKAKSDKSLYGEGNETYLATGKGKVELINGDSLSVCYGVTDDSLVITEGDIELPLGLHFKNILGNVKLGALWPHGRVPFVLSNTLTKQLKKNIQEAMSHWEQNTGIRFVPKKSHDIDYVIFTKHPKNSMGSSGVGKYDKKQFVRLGKNTGRAVAIHEIGHRLGLFHEQSRKDRDKFVRINWDNIKEKNKFNFCMKGDMVGPYDFLSRMHYSPYAFSRNGKPTIEPLDPSNQIKNDGWLSQGDIQTINSLYGFKLPIAAIRK